jgi:hypothetical protein
MGAKLKESDQYRFVHNMQLIMRVMFKKNISQVNLQLSMQSVPITRASNRHFARRKKTASVPRGQTETSLKIEDLLSNKTTGNFHKSLRED